MSETNLAGRAGGRKFTAQLTGAAWRKIQAEGDVSIESLL